ncbi:MAG: AAA family ATPase [Oscillospiraceae bacterium]|nr:AAA family ATPase [Oscillospiraceae bacterium]
MGRIVSVIGKGGGGKSTVSANLACVLALRDKMVLLVDGGTVYGSLAHLLGVRVAASQSMVRMMDQASPYESFNDYAQCRRMRNLAVATLGDDDGCMAMQAHDPGRLKRFLAVSKERFDFVINDCGEDPREPFTAISCSASDHIVEVVRASAQGAAYKRATDGLIGRLSAGSKVIRVLGMSKGAAEAEGFMKVTGYAFDHVLPFCSGAGLGDSGGAPLAALGAKRPRDREYLRKIGFMALEVGYGRK